MNCTFFSIFPGAKPVFVDDADYAIAVTAGADTFGILIGMEYDQLDTEILFNAEILFN